MRHAPALLLLLAVALAAPFPAAAQTPTYETVELIPASADAKAVTVAHRAAAGDEVAPPTVVLLGAAARRAVVPDAACRVLALDPAAGGVTAEDDRLGAALTKLRLRFRARALRPVLVAAGENAREAMTWIDRFPHEFAGVLLLDAPADLAMAPGLAESRGLGLRLVGENAADLRRRVPQAPGLDAAFVEDGSAGALAKALAELVPPAPSAPEAALDAYHHAAAVADADAYFGAMTADGVFLGTDGEERWERDAFRAFGAPYFRGESAWIFVPRQRHPRVDAEGRIAWFDEVVGSRHYGARRGSGVLVKEGETWRIAQYNLTTPVPNAMLADVVRRIRRAERGQPETPATTVVLVRHAEKAAEGGSDPALSELGAARARGLAALLRPSRPDALFATEYRRTRDTLAPLAEALGREVVTVRARDARGLVERIRREHEGGRVVVAGHSNTVPALIALLGVEEPVEIGEADYGEVFVVTFGGGRATLLRLRAEPRD
ncbi:MAG: nuclear transport factor 2 family protein [Planctomycetota bacterium]